MIIIILVSGVSKIRAFDIKSTSRTYELVFFEAFNIKSTSRTYELVFLKLLMVKLVLD